MDCNKHTNYRCKITQKNFYTEFHKDSIRIADTRVPPSVLIPTDKFLLIGKFSDWLVSSPSKGRIELPIVVSSPLKSKPSGVI